MASADLDISIAKKLLGKFVLTAGPARIVLEAFREIELNARSIYNFDNVPISQVFENLKVEAKLSDLLFNQLKTLNRLRNQAIHTDYRPSFGDALLAIGVHDNFIDHVWSKAIESSKTPAVHMCVSPEELVREDAMHRAGWREFQEITRRFFEKQAGLPLAEEVTIELASGPHRFDLVSLDRTVVIECKSYTWTKSGKRPSAKWTQAQMACKHLAECTVDRKILAFQDDLLEGKSLAKEFVRLNQRILKDIEVWRYVTGRFEKLSA